MLAVCSCAIQPIRRAHNLKSLSDCQHIMSSMPEASRRDLPPPPHLAGSPSSGPACILMAAQFAKSPSQLCSSSWRRFSICFSHLGHCPGGTSLYKHYCHLLLWAPRSSGPTELLCSARASPCPPSWSSHQEMVASCQHSLTPQFHSCGPGATQLPFPQAGFPCCYLIFFQLLCWHCPPSPTGLTEPGAGEVLL